MNACRAIGSSLLLLVVGPAARQVGDPGWNRPGAHPAAGGPVGNFNWKIGDDQPGPPRVRVIVDTSYCVIVNDQHSRFETVINGRVDVHDMHVTESGALIIQGPNPCVVTATGQILIEGLILAKGEDNLGVATLNTTDISEPGARGGPGGGRGGTGNPRTHMSSESGGPGFGAFDSTGRGGEGGESAFNPAWPADSDDNHRRPAGGGGGAFGHDFLRPADIVPGYTNPNACPDQQENGLDAEQGFSGYPGAIGVVSASSPPRGGMPGLRPFFDLDRTNDFWGTMSTSTGQLIRGELLVPWAGSGGGAGGNAIVSNSFPTTPFDPTGDEKGAGGGGGGGSLVLIARRSIVFGRAGRIDASGGTGGGGENSLAGGITHIGGGSGGGSGGHVVLESSETIDFSECRTNWIPPAGIYALGGQGGAGKDNLGGATPGGFPTRPGSDALPPDSYPSATAPCGVVAGTAGYGFSNTVGDSDPLVVICAGGDGGPGIIQLHVLSLDAILPPRTPGENIYKIIKPPPVQALPPSGPPSYDRINRPLSWNLMLPISGMHP